MADAIPSEKPVTSPHASHHDSADSVHMAEPKGLASNTNVHWYDQVDFSHLDEKKVLRKMDVRLIPMLAILYLLSFLDRGNIGNAKIEGLQQELQMTGSQYNWCCKYTFDSRRSFRSNGNFNTSDCLFFLLLRL
jgi:hypothetical protein